MAAKLEMLEKKMDQGTPACQLTMQPAPPTMIYPTAPIPPPMMPLGVSRIPNHPIPFSHHSYCFPSGKPKLYNALRRKKSKLRVRLSAAKCTVDLVRIKELENAIGLVSYEIKEAVLHHLHQNEKRAVERIGTNPKYFFSYAKSFSKVKQNISALLNVNQELVTERKELANILQHQFCSVVSDPNCSSKTIPTFKVPPLISSDTEPVLTPDKIVEAISEIKLDSAPGPDGIPAILLKRCATSLSVPIHLLWSESMSSGHHKPRQSLSHHSSRKVVDVNLRTICLSL